MIRRDLAAIVLAAALVAGPTACERQDGDEAEGGRDTLDIDVPDDVEENLERGARRVGGTVGEAIEETGEAIDRAGERIQEEAGEPGVGDTMPRDTL
jgi:hypothetical protein